jgi:hypothetical protein
MWHVWGGGEVHTGFRRGDRRERDHIEDTGVDALLNAVMKLRVPSNAGKFLTT